MFLILSAMVILSVALNEYSELVRSDVGVRILPLTITINSSEVVNATCTLTLHRSSCKNSPLSEGDTISWHTRICFNWKCDAVDHAMRVEDCWVGTRKSPVFLVKSDGCTAESAMLHTPSYISFLNAISIGWLSVRQQGMTDILVGCSITLCHFCDKTCQANTPPRICHDDSVRDYERMWNETNLVAQACGPSPESSSIPTKTGLTSQIPMIISIIIIVFLNIPKL